MNVERSADKHPASLTAPVVKDEIARLRGNAG
jgi:hypothetical protein